jgi:uracil-DNA glycosylase family 4
MKKFSNDSELERLNQKIISCTKCPRLSSYIRQIAKDKVKRFSDWEYWGRPLAGFGDPAARLLLVGLAPAAHGGNRTGRMFTGDSSGDWVARVLYENGFATKPTSKHKHDGFMLNDVYITAAARCAPPQNKLTKNELENCSSFLEKELQLLKNIKVIICLGKIAFDACCKILNIYGEGFSHAKTFSHNNLTIICSYHPSKQNTQTGRLVWNQWSTVFKKARKILDETQSFL